MSLKLKWKIKFTPVQILTIGFASIIFLGAIILSFPISSASGESTSFLDCIFIATSAVCVTGLVTIDTGTHWSLFGKTVIIFLIQIGGLGFMTFATLVSLLLGKKITLSERLIMQESLNAFSIQGMVRLVRHVLIFTFLIESIGAVLLSIQFIPEFGLYKGIYYSIFHSISAFCNAGFDLMGEFRSVTGYAENTIVILSIGILIVLGGIGFTVWEELYNYRTNRRLSLHSKVVLSVTAFLIIAGAILMFIFEMNNENTMGLMGMKGKVLSSLFASITPRTAGYNSISTSDMTNAGRFVTIVLMFIGGSPGSTAGGIKTTTMGVLLFAVMAVAKGKEDTEMFKKRVSHEIVYRAFTIVAISLAWVMVVTMILSITEVGASLEYILYEAISAFGTVGLTLGLTTKLTVVGKSVIALTMYIGRVGPLTLAFAFANKKRKSGIRYPEDKILVG